MNETEARDFIAKEVSRLLWMRLAGFATLFGIANIVALIGLWYSVTTQAEAIAKARASVVAEDKALSAVEGARQRIEAMTSIAETQVKGLVQSNSDLSKQLGRSEVNLTTLEGSYTTLEGKLKELESTVKAATADAAHQFAMAASEFAKLPDDQKASIKQAIDVAGQRLQSIQGSLAKLKSDLNLYAKTDSLQGLEEAVKQLQEAVLGVAPGDETEVTALKRDRLHKAVAQNLGRTLLAKDSIDLNLQRGSLSPAHFAERIAICDTWGVVTDKEEKTVQEGAVVPFVGEGIDRVIRREKKGTYTVYLKENWDRDNDVVIATSAYHGSVQIGSFSKVDNRIKMTLGERDDVVYLMVFRRRATGG